MLIFLGLLTLFGICCINKLGYIKSWHYNLYLLIDLNTIGQPPAAEVVYNQYR